MNRLLARAATLALTAPLAFALATGPASAETVTVPGCYGASNTIICELTISYGVPFGVETYETTVPVCALICVDAPVTLVRTTPGQPLVICAWYHDRNGNPSSPICTGGATTEPVDELRDSAAWAAEDAIWSICGALDNSCTALLWRTLFTVADAIRG